MEISYINNNLNFCIILNINSERGGIVNVQRNCGNKSGYRFWYPPPPPLFTKVSYRDVGTEKTSIVSFDAKNLNEAMIPSAVSLSPKGKLKVFDSSESQSSKVIDFLKMRLVGAKIGVPVPKFKDIEVGKMAVISAISSWYLATVIVRCMKWITNTEKELFQNRTPVWSANFGVPVDYWEQGKINRFESVFKVAWIWAEKGVIPSTIENTIELYEKNARSLRTRKLRYTSCSGNFSSNSIIYFLS